MRITALLYCIHYIFLFKVCQEYNKKFFVLYIFEKAAATKNSTFYKQKFVLTLLFTL